VIFEGCTAQPVGRFGSPVQWDAPVQLPMGLAQIGRNIRYSAQSTGTRYGLSTRIKFPTLNNPITGLGSIRYLSPNTTNQEIIQLLGYTQNDGNLYSLVPFQQSSLVLLTTDGFLAAANLTRTPGACPVITQAANRGLISLTNLVVGLAPGLIYDPNLGSLDQISERPFGEAWQPGTRYRVGQVVSPSQFTTFGVIGSAGQWIPIQTGFLFQCTQSGISGLVQPTWPSSGYGATGIVDNSAVWKEATPVALTGLPDPGAPSNPTTTPSGGSPIANGATVYLCCTYTNAQGEGINELVAPFGANVGQIDPGRVLVWKNTTGAAVNLTVTIPTIPAIFGTGGVLGADFGAAQLNLYAFIVPGAPDLAQITDPGFYAQIAGGPFNPGATVTISTYPSGQPLPTVNTAVLNLTPGNIPTGVRYGIELFETRTDYQTGWTNSTPIRINVTQSGQQLTVLRDAIGPYNCEARVWAFTVAGASAAGPYTYVDQADTESPGFNQPNVNITATRIPDNTTVTSVFNFTDTYLPGASNVTNYADRIMVPPFVDVFYSKGLQSAVYSGAQGYPSTLLVSDQLDMEAIRIPGSNLDVAINDGDRVICYREVRNIGIAFKENSAYAINSNDGDPTTWSTGTDPLWTGKGPVGAKGIAVSADDETQFAVFAHRTGLYLYAGGSPKLISREMFINWDTINWAYGHLIVVAIDEKHREIRISVPTGTSTVNNLTYTLNYFFGMGDPVVFSARMAHMVVNPDGRKWSVDDILASDLLYIPSRSLAEAQQVGVDIKNEMIFACNDGSLKTVTEKQYFDQDYSGTHVGYLSKWLSVPGQNPKLNIFGLEGATCSGIGNGPVNVYAVDDTGRQVSLSQPTRVWMLSQIESERDFGAPAGQEACRWCIGFDNGAIAGNWWEMHAAILWIIKKWSQRPG
jgi:hypothetical protein